MALSSTASSVSRHWLKSPSGGGSPTGMAYFRHFLQSKRPELSRSPILVIASEVGNDGSSKAQSQVSQTIQHVQFTLAQQLGLRTVSSTISSAYPTVDDIEQKLDLASRTGALTSSGTIVAVGSGAAIDLAKAVSGSSAISTSGNSPSLILVPATYPAYWACGSNYSLVVDSTEGAILPYPSSSINNNNNNVGDMDDNNKMIIAPLESKFVSPMIMTQQASMQVVYAASAIVLDAWYRIKGNTVGTSSQQDQEQLVDLVTKINTCLDGNNESDGTSNNISHETLIDISYQAGSLMSFGLDTSINDDRSSPLALATSLLAQDVFPYYNIITFYASLVPGICQIILQDNQEYDDENILVQQVTALIQNLVAATTTGNDRQPRSLYLPPKLTVQKEYEGYAIPDLALSHIHANQALWKCLDLDDTTLINILQHSLK